MNWKTGKDKEHGCLSSLLQYFLSSSSLYSDSTHEKQPQILKLRLSMGLAQSVEQATLDLGVASLSPTLSTEIA